MKKVFFGIIGCCIMAGQAWCQTISNKLLSVDYNAQIKTLKVKELATGTTFLKEGKLENADGQAKIIAVANADFGKGTAIVIPKKGGGYYTLTLFAGQPFVWVQETVVNQSAQSQVIQKAQPLSFLIDLNKKPANLKTLGTGGLLNPYENPGSYVFLTTVDPATRKGVVTGWLTNEKGSGVVFSDTSHSLVQISTQTDYGRLLIQPGKTVALETLLIGYFSDARIGEETFANTIAKKQHIKLKERKAVYCTWYSEKNGGAGNSNSIGQLAQFAAGLKDDGLGVIQLDDQWQSGDIFNGPARGFEKAKPGGPFPNGMEEPARIIKNAGLTAGIWWMPFARNHQAPEYKDRQHWFARRLNGQPYETKWGGTSLDLTNPEVKKHIADVAAGMKKWGFNYFKMDGLWTGTVTEQVYINDGYKNDSMGNCLPLFDSTISQVEAYRSGLKLIRNTVGLDLFLSGCCVSQNMRSFGASIGLVDAMRVGPDFNHDGQSIRTGAIRASRLYFLNGRVWWNDPDPSIIRESGASTADGACKGIGSLTRARLLPSWVAITGQFFLSSDWLPDLPEDRIDIMKKCMASHKGVARPVDAFDNALPRIWLASEAQTGAERNTIGLFNWDTTTQTIGSKMLWTGLKPGIAYYAFDFWENKPLPNIQDSFNYSLIAESCKIVAVRQKTNHPVLVSTSRHVTQGLIDVKKETWDHGTLSGESELVAGDDYELRIAGMNDGGKWKIADLKLDATDQNFTIKQLPSSDAGWARVVIHGTKSGPVKWKIRFASR